MSVEKFLLAGEKAELFSIKEVAEHGCGDGLIPSLIYYHDTNKFYDSMKNGFGSSWINTQMIKA